MIQAIASLQPHTPNLNEFFLEYDMYDGRILEVFELEDIFGRKIMLNELKKMCEDN